MKKILSLLFVTISVILTSNVNAATCSESNVTINSIRPVSGNYPSEKHQNTIELHHDSRDWCSLSDCVVSNRYRVVVEATDEHIVSAAYMAFVAGKKVDIHIDTSLGTKNGICVVSYLTVKK